MDDCGTPRPFWRRPRLVGTAAAAVLLLTAGGIFAAVDSTGPEPKPSAASPAAVLPNTIPLPGTYRADYGPATDLDGKQLEGATPFTVTWGVRSVCRPAGCVATASRLGGEPGLVPSMVFDDVGGRWVAVDLRSDKCKNNTPAEYWVVSTLQPRLDGTLAGEYSRTSEAGCAFKRTATFTRIGDVDVNSLPDPATKAPRMVSPAQALRGRYHLTKTFRDGNHYEADMAVRTDCLRTGDRCMSYFHNHDSFAALVYGNAMWNVNEDADAACSAGGTLHRLRTAVYPLPASPQDPITLLTGHGHEETTGPACISGDFDEKIERTGD